MFLFYVNERNKVGDTLFGNRASNNNNNNNNSHFLMTMTYIRDAYLLSPCNAEISFDDKFCWAYRKNRTQDPGPGPRSRTRTSNFLNFLNMFSFYFPLLLSVTNSLLFFSIT